MAKKTFQITPKLTEEKKPLPVQEMSVAQIQQIVMDTQQQGEIMPEPVLLVPAAVQVATPQRPAGAKQPPKSKKVSERPQGRPRREDKVVRVSSDLPEDLYQQMKTEINRNGYTMNGFLAKILREYFERKIS